MEWICLLFKDGLDTGGQGLLGVEIVLENFGSEFKTGFGSFFAHATNVANDKSNGNLLPTVAFFATFGIRAGISPCVTGNNAVDGSRIPVRAPMSDAWVGRSLTVLRDQGSRRSPRNVAGNAFRVSITMPSRWPDVNSWNLQRPGYPLRGGRVVQRNPLRLASSAAGISFYRGNVYVQLSSRR